LRVRLAFTIALLAGLPHGAALAGEESNESLMGREPCERHEPLRQPLFGDSHVHTTYSFDANVQDTRNTPRDAYRFAQGERMGIQPYDADGNALRTIQLDRPLDWTVVTDHSEFLGEVSLCTTEGSSGYDSWICRIFRSMPNAAFQLFATRGLLLKQRWGFCGEGAAECMDAGGRIWGEIQRAAEEAYDRSSRCRFSSFVGYEWTATVGMGRNLHRNVIFRNEKVPALPISWVETPSAVDLWDQLQSKCIDGLPGCDVLTIPHNSNLGAGLLFESARIAKPENWGGPLVKEILRIETPFVEVAPIDEEEARRRARWEPIVEIMQHKGASECMLEVGSTDEACGFELLPYDRFGAKFNALAPVVKPGPKSFVRWALADGLRIEQKVGANPFKFGIIAATDTHIAAPGMTDEKNHPGHGGAGMGAGDIRAAGFQDDLEFGPGGLGVVWAEENTRDSIFDAMVRREVYGTSGTRPIVRFFGGWDYPDFMCAEPSFVEMGYAGGVPMGGDLPVAMPETGGDRPRFAVSALMDAGVEGRPGTPLQRIQIIKGWVEGDATFEKVFDVAGGENGATVDLSTCEPMGGGAANLCAVWEDPDFDPARPAVYYARVLENPTCRWSQYVCNAAGVDCSDPESVPEGLVGCCSPEHHPEIQERAWTSPIWYAPTP